MSKVVLDNVTGGYALSVINDNFQKVEDALNNQVLYRDNVTGEPNAMSDDLDMNSKRIYNLPSPSLLSEAARLQDVHNAISGANSANLISYDPSGAGAVTTTVQAKLNEMVSVTDRGAVGDGITDDSAAFQNAINDSYRVYVPPGKTYKLGSTVVLSDNTELYGGGKAPWEPYTGGSLPTGVKSGILVNGILAFSAVGKNNASVRGLSIRSTGGTQSVFGSAPGYQAGAVGIDITGSSQFEASNISFHGLEVGMRSNHIDGSATAQMPQIDDWAASDCLTVFKLGTATAGAYTVRDIRIGTCIVSLHNGKHIEAHWCDGIRVEDVRLFQAKTNSIYLRGCVFVSFVGVTAFETGSEGVILDACIHVNLSGVTISRSGAYTAPPPFPQFTGLKLINCTDVFYSGLIEETTGMALEISGCTTTVINATVSTPFWTTGNATNASGAVNITNSSGTNLNISFGGTGHWVNVWADWASQQSLTGTCVGSSSTGVVRAYPLLQPGGYTITLPADIALGASGVSASIGILRVYLAAGKVLKTRSVQMTYPTFQLRTVVGGNAVLWSQTAEPDGGGISTEDKVLYDNSVGAAGYYTVDLTLRNPSGGVITVPAGTEVRISSVIV